MVMKAQSTGFSIRRIVGSLSLCVIVAISVLAVPARSQTCQSMLYFQGFEADNSGWFTPTRVASGTNGITSKAGSYHAKATGDFTRWGGYNSTFPANGYTTSIDIYLDLSATSTNDTRFDFTSAINNPSGNHRRDFAFNAGFYNDAVAPGSGSRFVVSASNNTGRGNSYPKNPGRSPVVIATSGWYTFQHHFYDNGSGILAVDLTIYNGSGGTVGSWTLSDPTDVIGTTVGGNRYGWFASNEFSFLAIDNTYRSEPATPPTVDAGADQTVYNGYSPMSCATLTASPSGASYLWSPGGATTQSITVCPTTTTTYTVTVTDANNCTGSDNVTVYVVDVGCQNGKVTICHNGNTLCVASAAVSSHLSHGDELGSCGAGKMVTRSEAAAGSEQLLLFRNHPNPFTSATSLDFMVASSGHLRLEIFSSSGERVRTLVDDYRDSGSYSVSWDGSNSSGASVPSGNYIVRLSSGGYMVQQQITLQK
jgi:hypothetical protein